MRSKLLRQRRCSSDAQVHLYLYTPYRAHIQVMYSCTTYAGVGTVGPPEHIHVIQNFSCEPLSCCMHTSVVLAICQPFGKLWHPPFIQTTYTFKVTTIYTVRITDSMYVPPSFWFTQWPFFDTEEATYWLPISSIQLVVTHIQIKPTNKGHIGDGPYVPCREFVLFSKVFF